MGFGSSSYATPMAPSEMTERTDSIQPKKTKTILDILGTDVRSEASITVVTYEQYVAEQEAAKAAEQAALEAERLAEEAAVAEVASIALGESLLNAAMSQLGAVEDCTALVENSLRYLGYSAGDLGPMQFYGYGSVVDPANARAGDIMMRPGHVAVYAGNGMAVHGGFGWQNGVTYTDWDSNPYNYSAIIRLQ